VPTNRSPKFVPQVADVDTPSELSPEELLAEAQEKELRRLCRAATPEVVMAMLERATGIRRQSEPNEEGVFEPELGEDGKPLRVEVSDGPAQAAGKAIIEFGYGKATQQVTHSGDRGGGGLTIVIEQISEGKVIDVHPTPEANVSIADHASEPVETP